MAALDGVDATVCYAVKANSNLAVIKTLANLGAGADVVSSGELLRALRAGVPADKIVFSGVGKTDDELAHALSSGILQINIESEPELAALDRVAKSLNLTAPTAVRINPHVDAHTHGKIATGRKEDKFGIDWTNVHEVFTAARDLQNINLTGLAVHIGSQLTELAPFRDAFMRLHGIVKDLRADGHDIQCLDLGGGLGIPYDQRIGHNTGPGPEEYGRVVAETLGDVGCRLLFEPGRLIVGNAGVLVTKVIFVKDGATRKFVIIDAAMNDLLRPSLYDARHEIVPVVQIVPGERQEVVDVVGPVCETGDTFATEIFLPTVTSGDLLAIRSAGAYGAVMSSTYNSRELIPEILVRGNDYSVVRKRIDMKTLLGFETIPDWLNN